MSILAARANLLRTRHGHEHGRVTYVELFFDLVFVFAVTQISHSLLEHLTPLGAARAALLLIAVWWVWIDTSWVTNWLDPQRMPTRLLLFALMLAGLVLSMSIPEAFADRGLAFAGAYAVMQVGRDLFMLWALRRHSPGNFRNFVRITSWHLAIGVLWIAGGLAEAEIRFAFWAAGVVLEFAGPWAYFWVPGLGRSRTEDWDVEGGHMAERCALFIIIALGESILVTGATFAHQDWALLGAGAFLAAFFGSVAMWWVYFHIGAERGSALIAGATDPGRLARLAYTYMHLPLVAGIILVAVADELTLAHPAGHIDTKTAVALLGGPAVYLLGNVGFKWSHVGRLPLYHLVGLGLLAALGPAVGVLTPVAVSAATTAVLILVAVWEALSLRPKGAAAGQTGTGA